MSRPLLRILGAVVIPLVFVGLVPFAPASAAGPLPANQVVFTVSTGGGFVPPVVYALESPSLIIYGDGRVLSVVRDPAGAVVPVRYTLNQVDPAAIASFVSWVSERGIVNSDTDFGQPPVTDMDSTAVMVHGSGAPTTASVYAFYPSFDKDVSAAQQKARAALRDVVNEATTLTGVGPAYPYPPNRVVVYEVETGSSDTATTAWPGPPPASFLRPSTQSRSQACGYLTGDAATAAYQAALNNPGAQWLVGGTTRVLAVNPNPLTDACP
ncbi:hypothetical protein [Mycobacterium sp. M26]|uniref:hypothetical protein n=1 Tax=Mycobacterium sp. M26 TaxID=1762962 RepID=UPI00073F7DBD|nr:hypothetical protein [Mycobacterium sp. M26]